MRTKYIKIGSFVAVGIFVILVGFLITQFSTWGKTDQMFPRLYKEMMSGWETIFPQEVATSNAYLLLQSGEYTQALALITGEDSKSYYNRGVIRTITAYEQASGGTMSGLITASTLVSEAQKDFLLAQNLQTNNRLKKNIASNIQTTAELTVVINAKTCYTLSREVLTNISGVLQQIDTSKTLLDQELQAIQKSRAVTPQACFDRWKETLTTSQTNLTSLHNILTDQEKIQQKDFVQKKQQPALCVDKQDPTVIQNMYDTQKMLSSFQEEHQQSASIRGAQDADMITQLCQATKNDSQLNQNIQSTIEKLLASLQNDTQHATGNMQPATNEIQYTPFNADDQKLLESIDKKNKIRIRQIQRLKSDPEYQGMEYIQTLFQEFYGNTGDFQ